MATSEWIYLKHAYVILHGVHKKWSHYNIYGKSFKNQPDFNQFLQLLSRCMRTLPEKISLYGHRCLWFINLNNDNNNTNKDGIQWNYSRVLLRTSYHRLYAPQ